MTDRPIGRTVNAVDWRRQMVDGPEAGGSEPHLFAADDGREYMTKASNQPQAGRVLSNEFLAGLALEWIGVLHPNAVVVDLPPELLAASPGARFKSGTPLAPGLAFGSEFWASNPAHSADPSLISNSDDVAGTLAFDTWIRNDDGRQYRLKPDPAAPGKYHFFPVDQGFCFGHQWTPDALGPGHDNINPPTPVVAVTRDQLEPYLARLSAFDRETAEHLVSQIPVPWMDDHDRNAVVEYLIRRAPLAVAALNATYPQV